MEQPKGRHLDDDELRQLDELTNEDHTTAPISYWAHVFALELARLNPGTVDVSMTMHRYAQALTKAALDGSLAVRDALTMMRVTVNEQSNKTHPDYMFNEVWVTKSDLHAWVVETDAPLRTRLLGFDMLDEQPTTDTPSTLKRVRAKWTDEDLFTLWNQSLVSGTTQTSLAKQYGISRPAIKKHLDTAAEKFSSKAKVRNRWGV